MRALERKAWIIIAEHQLEKRKKVFGEQAKVCEGCTEILICSGPISFHVCQAIDKLMADGLLKGPKKIYPFDKLRRGFLPVDEECLTNYGYSVKHNKLVRAEIPK